MMRTRPLLFSLLIFFIPFIALAQTGQGGSENSLLPEINPQDIEIRSEFQARFPGLRRQPILGFNPKPRVFQVDPNRMPFMETPEDAVADISITQLGRPEPPVRTKLSYSERINAYLRAGFGSFLTPEIAGYGFYELNEKSLLSANLNLDASDGHLDSQESGFLFFDLNTQYHQQANEKWRLSVDVGALADQHYLFNPGDFSSTPEKEALGASGKVTIRKKEHSFRGMEASLGGSLFETQLSPRPASVNSPFASGEVSEKTYFAQVSTYWPGARIYETFNITAELNGGAYSNIIDNNETWFGGRAFLEYQRLLNFTTRVKGTGGIEFISDPFSDKVYFTPEIEIKHNFTNTLSITGVVFVKPEMQTMQDHHQHNRFLGVRTQLRHSYNLGTSGEVNYQFYEGNRVFGGVNYSHIKNYAYYQRAPLSGNLFDFYEPLYGEANIFEIYGGASQQLVPETFWANARVYLRSPKLSSGGGTIPYEEKLGLEGSISYKPLKELTINGWAEYIGTREAPELSTELNAFLLLNAGVEYQINETFGVYAKLLNILGQDYEIWDGYRERPFQIFGGLTIKF